LHPGRFTAAQAETIIAEAEFDGIAERGEGNHLDFLAFEQAHFQKTLNDGIIPLNRGDAGTLTKFELVQRDHEVRILGGLASLFRGGLSWQGKQGRFLLAPVGSKSDRL
jgi:hypothetical protein